jgi:hypothetical protein
MQEAFPNMSTYRTIFSVIVLMLISTVVSQAQTTYLQENANKKAASFPDKKGQKFLDQEMLKREMSGRNNEPHHVMAMAYLQSIGAFAKALSEQAAGDNQLSADFARAAVNEMDRSLDKAEEHHEENLKTMSADKRSKLAVIMKVVEAQHTNLRNAVNALRKDVQNYTLDAQQIAADSAVILKHLDELSKMRGNN